MVAIFEWFYHRADQTVVTPQTLLHHINVTSNDVILTTYLLRSLSFAKKTGQDGEEFLRRGCAEKHTFAKALSTSFLIAYQLIHRFTLGSFKGLVAM